MRKENIGYEEIQVWGATMEDVVRVNVKVHEIIKALKEAPDEIKNYILEKLKES